MLILEFVEPKRKKKRVGAREARMGYCPLMRRQSRQAVPYHNRVRRSGTRPGLGVRDKLAWVDRTRTQQRNTCETEILGPVSR